MNDLWGLCNTNISPAGMHLVYRLPGYGSVMPIVSNLFSSYAIHGIKRGRGREILYV